MTGIVQHAFPGARVFIFGREVTADLINIEPTAADNAKGPNTARITLVSPNNRYSITAEDVTLLANIVPDVITLPSAASVVSANKELDPFFQSFNIKVTREENLRRLQASVGFERAQALINEGYKVLDNYYQQNYAEKVESSFDLLKARALRQAGQLNDPTKRAVIEAKLGVTQQVAQPGIWETGLFAGEQSVANRTLEQTAWLAGYAPRWQFYVGSKIFHAGDPVRVFMCDPYDRNRWFHKFSGSISDFDDTDNVESNEETVSFLLAGALRTAQYSRISSNVGIIDAAAVVQSEDFVARTSHTDDFSGLTLTEFVFTLFFGPAYGDVLDALVRTGNLSEQEAQQIAAAAPTFKELHSASDPGNPRRIEVPRFGMGTYDGRRSAVFIYGPDGPEDAGGQTVALEERTVRLVDRPGRPALALYQAFVDEEVRVSDLQTMAAYESLTSSTTYAVDSAALAPRDLNGDPTIEAVITAIGENPHRYPTEGRLIVLAPASLGVNTAANLLWKDFRGPELFSTFTYRLMRLYEFFERIEFSFYETGRGDILAEMPLYDFEPSDFGESVVTLEDAYALSPTFKTAGNNPTIAQLKEVLSRGGAGPFAPHFRLGLDRTQNSSLTFTDDKVVTQASVTYDVISGFKSIGNNRQVGTVDAVVTLRSLIPAFGVRLLTKEATVSVTPEGAVVYAALKLNQANADALMLRQDLLPMIRMQPNRPIEFIKRCLIATCRRSSIRIDWDAPDMSHQVDCNYARVWDGMLDSRGRRLYNPIGGAASRPMNYAALFGTKVPSTSTQPQNGTEAPPTPDANPPFGVANARPPRGGTA